MTRSLSRRASVITLAAMAAGCARPAPEPAEPAVAEANGGGRMVGVGMGEQANATQAAPGEEFSIQLSANPSAGTSGG